MQGILPSESLTSCIPKHVKTTQVVSNVDRQDIILALLKSGLVGTYGL